MADRPPIAFVDRFYDDPPFPASQPWPRMRRDSPDEPELTASVDPGGSGTSIGDFEEAAFESAEEAIAWARKRAALVVVRLGTIDQTYYTAGEVQLTTRVDGTGGT
jgi:hypothetical protein